MPLHVHDYGPAAGEPIVCLHGITSHGPRFRTLAERLAPRFRLLALDLRGHGESDREPPWDLAQHVDDVLEAADGLGLEQPVWMGHSFGGRILLELAAQAPQRVDRLVLLDPAVWVPPPRALQLAEQSRADESFASPQEAVESRIAARIAPRARREVLEVDLAAQLESNGDGRWRWRYSRASVVAGFGEMAKLPQLERVRTPTLLVRGEETEVVPPELLGTLRELWGGELEIVDVPGGHNVMWDAPEETAAAVERFLAP